ncbi:MAG: VanZ family protein [Nitrospirae bacterium]|nr:VanZ family protein [Nitrospirota bacterium]MDE3040749.1 VanZ family protein [Nitrospirota bacterium]
MNQVLWYWVPVALYAGGIFFMSAQSHPEDQLPSFLFKEVSDKVLHAVEYGILSLLCYRAFRRAAGPAVARQAVVLAILTASVYGLTDEVHQAFVPLREATWQDWLADTIGAVIGAMSWRSIRSE